MKRLITAVFVFLMFISLCAEGSAAILDLSDVDGKGYFQDTLTGKTWMDLDNFFGQSYNTIKSDLALSGYQYHIATLSDLQELADSVDPSKSETWYPIIGGTYLSYPGISYSEYSFRGFYDDGDVGDKAGLGRFGYSIYNGTDSSSPWALMSDYYSSTLSHDGIGTWVVSDFQTAAVPEPMTLFLFGTGLVGFAIRRKKV